MGALEVEKNQFPIARGSCNHVTQHREEAPLACELERSTCEITPKQVSRYNTWTDCWRKKTAGNAKKFITSTLRCWKHAPGRWLCAHIDIREHQPSSGQLLCTISSAIAGLHLSHVTVNNFTFVMTWTLCFSSFCLNSCGIGEGYYQGTQQQTASTHKGGFSWLIAHEDPASPTSKTMTNFSGKVTTIGVLISLYSTATSGGMPLVPALEPYVTTTTIGFFFKQFQHINNGVFEQALTKTINEQLSMASMDKTFSELWEAISTAFQHRFNTLHFGGRDDVLCNLWQGESNRATQAPYK